MVAALAESFMNDPQGNFDIFVADIKTLLVKDCLCAVQFAIYADDTVEESELDIAYPILKSLAAFY
jgi:hypothetical protein